MTFSAIRTGRYSYEVHTQNIEEVKSLETRNKVPASNHNTTANLMTSFPDDNNYAQFDVAQNGFSPSTTISDSSSAEYESISRPSSNSSSASQVTRRSKSDSDVSGNSFKTVNGSHALIKREYQTLYSDEENAEILKNLMSAQDGLLEDLDVFLDEIKLERRKKTYLVSMPILTPSPHKDGKSKANNNKKTHCCKSVCLSVCLTAHLFIQRNSAPVSLF